MRFFLLVSRFLLAAWVIALILPQALPAQDVTSVYAHFSDSIVHLPSGDSLEFQAIGPASAPNEPPGLLVSYYPFISFDDTVRVRAIAIAFFRTLLIHLDAPPQWIVMRAENVRAARRDQGGFYDLRAFGVVLEHRPDGRWYALHESQAIDLR